MQIGKPVLGLDGPPIPSPSSGDLQLQAIKEKLKFENGIKGAAGWFFWIAGLSMLNSVLVLFGMKRVATVIGLGTALLANAHAFRLGPLASIAGLVVSTFLSTVFVVLGIFARKEQKWAFMVGIVLYALDTVAVFFFRHPVLSVVFHFFVLLCLFAGLGAIDRKRQAEADLAQIR